MEDASYFLDNYWHIFLVLLYQYHFYSFKLLVFQEHALFLPPVIVIFYLKISYTSNYSFVAPKAK